MLDDDVVEIRLHAHQHLADDVDQREMFGVDRRGAARAGSEEQRVSFSPTTSLTGNRPGGGTKSFRGRLPDASICPCACAQMIESTWALMMRPG